MAFTQHDFTKVNKTAIPKREHLQTKSNPPALTEQTAGTVIKRDGKLRTRKKNDIGSPAMKFETV